MIIKTLKFDDCIQIVKEIVKKILQFCKKNNWEVISNLRLTKIFVNMKNNSIPLNLDLGAVQKLHYAVEVGGWSAKA